MLDRSKLGLNRIIHPALDLEGFFKLTADLGLGKVELRNDLPGGGIVDGQTPGKVKELARKYSLQIITINALQKFNLGAVLAEVSEELKELAELARAIGCAAIVLCPNNDLQDKRDEQQKYRETVAALKAFHPIFEQNGITGLVEPLGFAECSLRSVVTAMKAIQETGSGAYKIVHDTFHHALGPDSITTLENAYNVSYTGLIHVSGVESPIPTAQYRDAQRILLSPADRLKSREQIRLLQKLGYRGDISFEPFAKEIQDLKLEELKETIHRSIAYLSS